ncbi:MAG: tRNA dihydrouridine synthase DusB [Acidobacteriota bacterium]|nr:MAG: tRNA dihydrouridine synthase DusB [Acidobacteriota bacterium]
MNLDERALMSMIQNVDRPKPLMIGRLCIDPPLALAPMAGICDRHFRLLVRRVGGVGLVSMEFISSEAITRGVRPELDKLAFSDEERPLAIQIYGRDAQRMADCAAIVDELGADVCDINMGCPANKVLKGCAGASLMGDLDRARRIIEACRRQLTIPLTVKFRLGLGRGAQPVNYLELGKICEDLGVDAVTLHGRTAKQMYTGRADWEQSRWLKQSLRIPVIGNGDVASPHDAVRMLQQTGCDGVMIGRGVLADPWIFRRTASLLAGSPPDPPTLGERLDLIRTHFRWIVREYDQRTALHKLRTFTGKYTRGLPNGRRLRHQIGTLDRADQFLPALERHFDELQRLGQELSAEAGA